MIEVKTHECFLCGRELTNKNIIWKKEGKGYFKVVDSKGIEIHHINVICDCALVQQLEPMTEESLNFFYSVDHTGLSPYRKIFKHHPKESQMHLSNTLQFINISTGFEKQRTGNIFNPYNYLEVGGAFTELRDVVSEILPSISKENVYSYDPGIAEDKPQVLRNLHFKKFDLVTIINCLEHVYNPVKLLMDLKDNITPSSRIIIGVPDLLNTHFNTTMDGWFSSAHVYAFEMNTLLSVIEIAGYDPVFGINITEASGMKNYLSIKLSDKKDIKPRLRDAEFIQKRIDFIKYAAKMLDIRGGITRDVK